MFYFLTLLLKIALTSRTEYSLTTRNEYLLPMRSNKIEHIFLSYRIDNVSNLIELAVRVMFLQTWIKLKAFQKSYPC